MDQSRCRWRKEGIVGVGLAGVGVVVFALLSITVLNIQSYPTVGGSWVVDFNTTGRADLIISAVNGTVFGKDLLFEGIYCSGMQQSHMRVGDSYVVKDYSCLGVGRETSKVLTSGKHTLRFQFGGEEAYAYNSASGADWVINYSGGNQTFTGYFASANLTVSKATHEQILEQKVTSGLVGHWTFDEGDGTVAHDERSFENDGNVTNTGSCNWTTSGKIGGGLAWNGANGYVTFGDPATLEGFTGITVMAWVNSAIAGSAYVTDGAILSKFWDGSDRSFQLYIDTDDYFHFQCATDTQNDGDNAESATVVSSATWYHVVGVWSASSGYIEIYVDGVLGGTNRSQAGATVRTNSAPLYAGREYYGGAPRYEFNGTIDDVRIYNRSLTPTEINQTRDNENNGVGYGSYAVCTGVGAGTAHNVTAFFTNTSTDYITLYSNGTGSWVAIGNLTHGTNLAIPSANRGSGIKIEYHTTNASLTPAMEAEGGIGVWCGAAAGAAFTLTLNATASDDGEILTRNHSYQEAYGSAALSSCLLEWDGTNESGTVSGTRCYLNKTGLSDGNYSYKFFANDTSDNWNHTSTYWVVIDVGAPTVTLQEQWGSTKSTSITFKYKPEDASNNITNCSLWGDFNGTWLLNQTDTTITAGLQNSFTVIILGNGTYSWNVICYDWNSQSAWGSENKTLIVNTGLEGIQNGDFEDTTSWDYYESNENYTGAYHYFNGTYAYHMDNLGCCGDGRTNVYELGYPAGLPGYAGSYSQITQNVTVPSGSEYTLSFVVRDSYYGGYIAQKFHWKQVYLDGVKAWEDDAYTQEGCQYVEFNATSYFSGKSTVNLTLRQYILAGFSNHGVTTYWDNVTLLTSKPSRIQNGLFESYDYWKNTSDGNFTGQYNTSGANHEATEGVYNGKRSYEISTNGTNTQGKYYSINQTINVLSVAESDPYRIRLWVKDDYTGSTANNYLKELLVDGSVVWRDDVKGSEASGDIPRGWDGWMFVNENVESNLRGKSTADISLRVYANSTTTFNVTVWFDAVEVYTGIDYWNRRLDNTRGALGGYAYHYYWNQYDMVGNNWNTFFHYISDEEWRWNNFTLFVNSSKGQMRVFACILPLSDEFGSPTGGSYPYHKNYLDWPKHMANMSKKYPNLRGLYVDDFSEMEVNYVRQMMKNARDISPSFTFLPNQYYIVAAETRMETYATSLDGSSWCYRGLSGDGKSDASLLKNETLLTKKAYGEKLLIGHPYTTFVQDFNGTSYEQEQTYLWGDGSTPYILNGGIHLKAASNLYERVGEYESTAVGNGGFESTANWLNKTTNANFNLVYNSSISLGGSKSLQMSFPASTALALNNYSEISQVVTLPLNSSRYRITGWVRDDYNQTTNKGYWFKQIAVDGEVIWEDDVEDFESNVSGEKYPRWGWFNEDLTRYANETVNFTFRLYLKKDITNFGVNVWWDNITLLQTKIGVDNGDMEATNASARETMWRFIDSKRYGMAYGSGAYGTHYYVGAFVDTDSNFTGTFSTTEKLAGTYSYKVTVSTIANNTDYAQISQVVNIALLNQTWFNVSVKDNITSGANNYTNSVRVCYLNTTYDEQCMTLWSDDVDGNEGWQNISVRLDNATALGDRTIVEVQLRTTANTNPDFPVATYWDAAEVYVPAAGGGGGGDVTDPVLSYHTPTESNNSFINVNHTRINLSVVESGGLDGFHFNLSGQKNVSSIYYDDSLVLAMNFNNLSAIGDNSTHVMDISQYGNNGSFGNDATWTASGKYGSAVTFDGIGDYVNCGADSSLDITGEITIEMWVKPDGVAKYLISKNHLDASDHQYAFYLGSTHVTYYPTSTLTSVAGSVPLDVWTNIVLTRISNGTGQFYINGVASGSPGTILMPSKPTFPVRLGCRWNNGADPHLNYDGKIDELRIYSRALTADEIWLHYQSEFMKYNSSEYRYSNNLTGLEDGEYQHYGWANDTAGNSGSSETRYVTIDTIYPVIAFDSGTEATNTYFNRTWIYANWTYTEINLENITAKIFNSTGSLINQTNFTSAIYEINWTLSDTSELYYYNVTICDSAGNCNNTETRTLGLGEDGLCRTHTSDVTFGSDFSVSGDCIVIGAHNLNVYGSGYSLNGNTSGIGIACTSYDNLTVDNLTIDDFNQNIYLRLSDGATLSGITLFSFHAYNSTPVEVNLPETDCRYGFRNADIADYDWVNCNFNISTPCCRVVKVESYEAKGIPTNVIIAFGTGGFAFLVWIWRRRRGR